MEERNEFARAEEESESEDEVDPNVVLCDIRRYFLCSFCAQEKNKKKRIRVMVIHTQNILSLFSPPLSHFLIFLSLILFLLT